MLTLAAGGVGHPALRHRLGADPRRGARTARRRAPAQPPRHLAGRGRDGLPDALRRCCSCATGASGSATRSPGPAVIAAAGGALIWRQSQARRPESPARSARAAPARGGQPGRRRRRAGGRRRAAVPLAQRLARPRPRRRPAGRGRPDRGHDHPRAVVDPARPRPRRRARRADPLAGARRGRRAPARLACCRRSRWCRSAPTTRARSPRSPAARSASCARG